MQRLKTPPFAVESAWLRRGVVVEGQHNLQRTVAGRGVRVDDRGERIGVVGPLSGFREAGVGDFAAVYLHRFGREGRREAHFVAAAVRSAGVGAFAGRDDGAQGVALLLLGDLPWWRRPWRTAG